MSEDLLLNSLLAAVDANPTDFTLRLHVATMLLERGKPAEALAHCSAIIQAEPQNSAALDLLQRASQLLVNSSPNNAEKSTAFNWKAAEQQLADISPKPPFVDYDTPEDPVLDFERSTITLADISGLDEVKQRLEIAFLGPMRSPELAKAFGKSLRGGLLLYGPPGCGKTFIARAVAGELGAKFTSVNLADVLGPHFGDTEQNIKEIFQAARRNSPCVLFFDEVDAIGHRRSRVGSGLRSAVNQLLTEMDSVGNENDGLFILAATNHPWDVDPALRRPGRFDRTALVLPPDEPARIGILQHHLAQRPIEGIDLRVLVRQTEDFSGADLAHLCETAAELALADSVKSGTIRPINMADFNRALSQVKPSNGPWFETARNVALFANSSGEYDELIKYLKKKRLV